MEPGEVGLENDVDFGVWLIELILVAGVVDFLVEHLENCFLAVPNGNWVKFSGLGKREEQIADFAFIGDGFCEILDSLHVDVIVVGNDTCINGL